MEYKPSQDLNPDLQTRPFITKAYMHFFLLVRSPWPHSALLLGGRIPTYTAAIRTLDYVPISC